MYPALMRAMTAAPANTLLTEANIKVVSDVTNGEVLLVAVRP